MLPHIMYCTYQPYRKTEGWAKWAEIDPSDMADKSDCEKDIKKAHKPVCLSNCKIRMQQLCAVVQRGLSSLWGAQTWVDTFGGLIQSYSVCYKE